MSLLFNFQFTSPRPATLTEAVAQARWPRNRATHWLATHREELLQLRQSGESVGSLVGGLSAMGIEIGHETLRLWLNRELGHKPAKRRRSRRRTNPALPNTNLTDETSKAADTAKTAVMEKTNAGELPQVPPDQPAVTRIEDIPYRLPGETPMESFRRRLATRETLRAAMQLGGAEPPGTPNG